MARSAPNRIWQSAELVEFAENSPTGYVRRFPLKGYWRELSDPFVAANIVGSECVPQPRGAGESSEVFRKQAGGRGGWQPFAEGEEVVFLSPKLLFSNDQEQDCVSTWTRLVSNHGSL